MAGGAEDILTGLNAYGLTIDEGFVAPGEVRGAYGPYQQSERVAIYQCYVKSLVEKGLAYPCFCTEEQRQAVREQQEEAKQRTGYYGAYARLNGCGRARPTWCGCAPPAARKTASNSTI